MNVKSRQYRTVEMMRHKNRREQRRYEHSMNSKHGLLASHKHEMKTVSKETARVQQELNQITRSYPHIRRPAGDYGRPSRPAPGTGKDLTNPGDNETMQETQWGVTKETSPRRSKTHQDGTGVSTDQEDGTSVLLNEPAKQQTSSKTRGAFRANNNKSNNSNKRSKLISINNGRFTNNKDDKRLYDDFVNNDESGVKTNPPVEKDCGQNGFQSEAVEEQQKSPRRSSKIGNQPIGYLSISDAKENVAKRLLSSKNKEDENNASTSLLSARSSSVFEGAGPIPIDPLPQFTGEDAAVPKNKASTLSLKGKSQKKAYEEMVEKLRFEAETYGPDGKLRTMHVMPSFEQRMEQAKKARYIRHRERPDFEKELSVSQMFEGMKSDSKTLT